jgi:hypothetical protein
LSQIKDQMTGASSEAAAEISLLNLKSRPPHRPPRHPIAAKPVNPLKPLKPLKPPAKKNNGAFKTLQSIAFALLDQWLFKASDDRSNDRDII